jgi:GNAT superfamily N-acetyltransferase
VFHVREATLNDKDFIIHAQLAMALETESMHLDKATVTKGVNAVFEDASKGRYFVVEQKGKVLGALLTTYEWSDWRNGTVLWIHSLYVESESRGHGAFRAMYDYLYEFVEKSNGEYRGLRLYVDKRNKNAQAVYQKIGMSAEHYEMYEWLKS